ERRILGGSGGQRARDAWPERAGRRRRCRPGRARDRSVRALAAAGCGGGACTHRHRAILAAPAAQAECDLLARAVARSEGTGVVRAGAAAGQLSRAARRAMPAVPDSLPAFVYAHDRPVPPVVAHRLVEQVPAQRAVVTTRLEQREDQAAERLLRRDDPRSGRNRKLHGLVTARGGAFVMLLELAFGDPRGIDGESLDARIAGRRHLAHLDAVRTQQVDDL